MHRFMLPKFGRAFPDNVERAVSDIVGDSTDVFPQYADANKLDAADEQRYDHL